MQRCFPPGSKSTAAPVVDRLYSLRVGGTGARRGVRHFHQLYADATRLVRTMQFDEILTALEDHLDSVVATEARGRLFVHAGVVGWHGHAILIPGASGSGKTSLVAALVQAGASYYSDEYAVLDARGRVHPFPRPLSIRTELGEPSRRIRADDLGGVAATTPLSVGLIVVTQHRPGASWRPRSLSPGQAFFALLRNTVAARAQPDKAVPVLRQVASQAPALTGRRGEAAATAGQVLLRAEEMSAPFDHNRRSCQ